MKNFENIFLMMEPIGEYVQALCVELCIIPMWNVHGTFTENLVSTKELCLNFLQSLQMALSLKFQILFWREKEFHNQFRNNSHWI